MPISSEITDDKILSLLGLEDRFDIPADEYFQLLQERIQRSAFGVDKLSAEELALLSNEKKRVRDKKDTKEKLKIKKTKITADGLGIKKPGEDLQKTLPSFSKTTSLAIRRPSSIVKSEVLQRPVESQDFLGDSLSAIRESVDSILKILVTQNKIKEKAVDEDRKKSEREKRSLAESKLEKRFDGLKKVAEKILAPVKSILDRITQFLVNVLLGRVVYKLIEWLGDPTNASKVKSIIRFVKDWWPALLGAYVLFGTTFGKFVRGTVGLVGRFIFQIGKVAIPGLLKFIAKNPKAAAATTLFTAGATIPALFPQTVDEQERKTKAQPGSTEDKIKSLQQQKSNLNFFEKLQGKGAEIDEQISFLKTGKTKSYGFSGGGLANGFVSGEKGVDKIPAMLSDGEFVMSRGAVETWGLNTLEAMNAAGGGTNKPRVVQGTTFAAGGGPIGQIGDSRKGLIDIYNWFNSQGVNLQDPRTWSGTGGKFATGIASGLSAGVAQGANQLGNFGVSQFNRANNYLASGGLEKSVTKLMQSGTQFGAGLYDQALNIGNKALSDVQSGKFQNRIIKTGAQVASQAAQLPKKVGGGIFDAFKNLGSSKGYQNVAATTEKLQDKTITLGDKFIKNLPDGPFKEIADKGLIPIPSGNPTMMRNLTFMKALLGPIGRPFKILSNKQVDDMRRQTIERTMGKSGLIVDPKTGEVRMNWNQEDINKAAKGGGAYTDDLGPGGAAFNSILGRFSAKTEGKGNTLYSDDRYNFNKTVAEYAEMAKQGLMKGSISDATYFGASMLGRFAQDIGWLNQRALGSRIEIGKIDRSSLDPKTGKKKTPEQMAADQAKMKQEAAKVAKQRANKEKLEAKRPWWDKLGMFGGASAQIKKDQEFLKKNPGVTLYDKSKPKAQVAKTKPKSPNVAQSTKPKPKVTVINKPASKPYRGGQRSGRTKTPNFSPVNPSASSAKAKVVGVKG